MLRVSELRKLLVSLDIDQHNTLKNFAVKSTISEISGELRNLMEAVQLRILVIG